MSQFDASLYRVADRLDEIDPVNLENTEYVWDGEEYDSVYELLDRSDLVADRPDIDLEYSDFVPGDQASELVASSEEVTARLVNQEGDTGDSILFNDGEAAQIFYEWSNNRANYSFDTEPAPDDARPKDSKRVHELNDQPFLTVQEQDDGTVRYGVMTVGNETGESPCLYIRERFPSDIIYLEGTVDASTAEAAVEGELETERAPEIVEQACRLAPDDLEQGEIGDNVAELYSMLVEDTDGFGYEEYVELADELRGNIHELEAISDTMQKYYFSKAVEQEAIPHPNKGLEEDQAPKHLKSPDFYGNVLESRVEEFAEGYENARHAVRFTDLATHITLPYEPGEEGESVQLNVPDDSPLQERWIERLEHEHPETYEVLHDTHQSAASPVSKALDTFRPKMREMPTGEDQRVDPSFMLFQIDVQGVEAVDEFFDEMLDQQDAEPWEGNETTEGMFQ